MKANVVIDKSYALDFKVVRYFLCESNNEPFSIMRIIF